jgi:prepilin-type N-terminal cleavage/methylation domain-containing protein
MSKTRTRSTVTREGFSLVEVLVALVVLSIGVLAVASMAASSVTQVRMGFNLTNSTLAAQQVLDGYLVMPFDSLPLGQNVDTVDLGSQDYVVISTLTDVSSQLAVEAPDVLYQIVVYAGGGNMDRSNLERFETFIFNRGS